MFNRKQSYWLGALVLILGFVFVQQQVIAQWAGPTQGPTGSGVDLITNPLTKDLNLNGWDLTNASSSPTNITGINNLGVSRINNQLPVTNPMSANLDLGNHELTGVTKINGQEIQFGGGITNKMTDNLSGQNQFYIYNLKGCDPAKDTSCAGLAAIAGKNTFNNTKTFSFGVWGQTDANSGMNPSYGVYGLANNSGGVGVVGHSVRSGSIGVYGVSQDVNGFGGVFYNQAGGTALVVDGAIDFDGLKFLRENGGGGFTPYAGTEGVRLEAGHLTVDGHITSGPLYPIGNSEFSGNLTVVGEGYFDYLVHMDGGAEVEGYLRTQPIVADVRARDDDNYPFGVSAIVGIATSTNAYEENSGVIGVGTVGVFGHGRLIGVYGSSGAYAGLFKGYTDEAVRIDDPQPDRFGTSGELPVENPFASLLGINKTVADVSIPAAIGIVATGGWDVTGANFNSAGLGICALSGEKAYAAEQADGDFYEYCKAGGINNFAGFFAGDVYIKEGSMQLNDTLAAAGENLIYGNIGITSVAGASLIKLQNNGVDKFRVDKDGATTFPNLILNKTLGASESLIFSNLNGLTSGNLVDLQVGGSSKFKVTRDGITTFGSSITSPANLFLSGNGSYINFDGNGQTWPACNAANEGVLYYGKINKLLCACNGTSWQALDNDFLDAACSNNPTAPQPLH